MKMQGKLNLHGAPTLLFQRLHPPDSRDFKQIATAGANTAAGSKFPPK